MTGDEPNEGEEAAAAADVEKALAEHRPAEDRSDTGDTGVTAVEKSPDAGEETGGLDGETIEITVPPNLLRAWEHRADHAKLTVSECVVRMTEAGRMSVQMQPSGDEGSAAMSVEQLTDEVVDELRHEDAVPWEHLVDAISRNLEMRLEEALERLQEDDVVRYSGLAGGYQLVDED